MKKIKFILIVFFLLISITPIMALTNNDCLMCHGEKDFTVEKNNKQVSLYINNHKLKNSIHSNLNCVACHRNFNPEEIPHKQGKIKVDCFLCHSDVIKNTSKTKHKKLGCINCHANIHYASKNQFKKNSSKICSKCHKQEYNRLKQSIHFKIKQGANCIDCHTHHKIKFPGVDECLKCHSNKQIVHEKAKIVLKYKDSIHGKYIKCSDCHSGHKILPADDKESSINKKNLTNICSRCHQEQVKNYLASAHGNALKKDFQDAPTCIDCHGEHNIYKVTDNKSPVSREHEIKICLKCHLHNKKITKLVPYSSAFITSYENSVHGKAIKKGNFKAAICSDCHGAHLMNSAGNRKSTINQFNISNTCSKCHKKEAEIFKNSIHGKALANKESDAPTCTTCHGEHKILSPNDKNADVYKSHVSEEVCANCHSSVKLSEKYGIPLERVKSFKQSFHGLAVEAGDIKAANCVSCHGYHNILPQSDTKSSINKNNLSKTCGKCHKNATNKYAYSKVHITIKQTKSFEDTILYFISIAYIILIILTISSMLFHNAIDFIKKIRNIYKQRFDDAYSEIQYEKKKRLYIRMTLNERIMHFLLFTSFFILVITGFMLKFPDAGWVKGFRFLLGEHFFALRGIIHRIAAIVMTADALYHLIYLFFTKRGRQFFIDMFPKIKDIKDSIGTVLYNLGIKKKKPEYERFSYIEKSEYWALVWGTIIMSATGIILWFEEFFISLFGKIIFDISEVIHYYEAWLAFLAIIVWHLYFVIFNPDVYPMNFAWFKGHLTEKEMEEEHPLELKKIKEESNNSNK